MNAKEKALEHCRKNKLIVPFFSKRVNKVFDEALDMAIQETKKEVFDDIDEFVKRYDFWLTNSTTDIAYKSLKKKHHILKQLK